MATLYPLGLSLLRVHIIALAFGLSVQGRINHSGAPYQRKAGLFSRTRSQDFLICGGALFPQKS